MRTSCSHGGLREHFLVRFIFQDWKESQSWKIKKLLFVLLLRNHHDRSYFLFATSQVTLGSGACSPGRLTACKILEQDRHTLQNITSWLAHIASHPSLPLF